MKKWQTLVRREFWEHRGMWLAPLGVAGFLALMTVIGGVHLQTAGQHLSPEQWRPGLRLWHATTFAVAALIYLMVGISVTTYLLDTLYADRKDRSILFWRSLPVSDRDMVLAKFAVAMLLMPLFAWAVAVLTHLVCSGILFALVPDLMRPAARLWGLDAWLRANATLLYVVTVAILWYAPLASWLLLASVWAKRSPFLYAFLPMIAAVVIERLVAGSSHLQAFLFRRLAMPDAGVHDGSLDGRGVGVLLASPDLWLGVVAAALMLALVIRLRRYRDDT